MPTYKVRIEGQVVEHYAVEADSPTQAGRNWHEGELLHSEAFGMDESTAIVELIE